MFVEHKEAGEVTEAPAKTLKLSEAMRRGAQSTSQCTNGNYISGNAACAYGAAAIGMGGGVDLAGMLHVRTIDESRAFLKAHGFSIMSANDRRGWSREAIADALEALGY